MEIMAKLHALWDLPCAKRIVDVLDPGVVKRPDATVRRST